MQRPLARRSSNSAAERERELRLNIGLEFEDNGVGVEARVVFGDDVDLGLERR
ncbi:hypothetical protein A2U01_0068042, partial [Trifolium medium]|nr:hypothetical protein [Trifolium medium]